MKNILKIASLLAAAVMLFACEKAAPVGDLQLNIDKVRILADGKDSVKFVVLWENTDVTASAVIDAENVLTGQKFSVEGAGFSTTEESIYRFSVTYNEDYVAKLVVAKKVIVDANADIAASFKMSADKDVIQANGQDAAVLKVLLEGFDITSAADIYTKDDELLNLKDGKFTTNATGEHKFYADFGTLSTYNKNADDNGLFVIKAISVAVPDAVEDPQVENTSFNHRTFLTQYTGTGCGYCPYMIRILREIMSKNLIPEKAVLAAVHSYGSGDPAYISVPKVSNYPYLQLDFVQGFSHSQSSTVLETLIGERTAEAAKAGISVAPAYYPAEGILVVKVAVKAAVDGVFNVGAWLLEDNIIGQQADYDNIGDDTYDEHENCVRIADSKYVHNKATTWFGYELGTLSKGRSAEKIFVMKIDKKWKAENLHLAVFASYGEGTGTRLTYSVCNAVDVPITEPTPFEYAK